MDIENIAQILQSMLASDNSGEENAQASSKEASSGGDHQNNDSAQDNNNAGFGDFFAGIDLEMIMKMGELFAKFQQQDKNISLLIALKPHMRPENQEKIDTAIRLVRIMGLIPHIKDMGLLDKLF